MTLTSGFRRQHDEILSVVTEIKPLLVSDSINYNSSELISLLSVLSGKLAAHLTMEDKVLYPKLAAHPQTKIKSTAKDFFDEMGGLSKVFADYCNKWSSKDKLEANPDDFVTETENLFEQLANRINRENTILYPMADEA